MGRINSVYGTKLTVFPPTKEYDATDTMALTQTSHMCLAAQVSVCVSSRLCVGVCVCVCVCVVCGVCCVLCGVWCVVCGVRCEVWCEAGMCGISNNVAREAREEREE